MIALSVDLATLEDTAAICALDRQILGSDGRGGEIERAIDSGTCFVARIGGARAGYAIHDRSLFGRPFLALLVVDSTMRRRGVGTALVRHLEAVVDGDRLFTSTNRSNAAMRRLCERLGFIESGRIDNLDSDDPEVIYVKWLL